MTWQWYFRDFRLGDASEAAEWLATHISDGTLSDRDQKWVLAGFDMYLDDAYQTPHALLDRLQRTMMSHRVTTLDGCTEVLFREYVEEHLTAWAFRGYKTWGPLTWRDE